MQKISKAEERQYFVAIVNWLEKNAGLHFPPGKHASLLSRLYQFCIKYRIANFKELALHIKNNDIKNIQIELINVATTNHTAFFREMTVLNYFRDRILPVMNQHSDVRIWSAASSSGEEAYTLAMIIADTIGKDQLSRYSILGTDINQEAITKAENGHYFRGLKDINEHCEGNYVKAANDNAFDIIDAIKSRCTFRRINLKSKPWPLKRQFHLVACRNVLYYFNQQDQTAILQALYNQTEKGGWLLTSVTESLRELNTPWQLVESGIYQKK